MSDCESDDGDVPVSESVDFSQLQAVVDANPELIGGGVTYSFDDIIESGGEEPAPVPAVAEPMQEDAAPRKPAISFVYTKDSPLDADFDTEDESALHKLAKGSVSLVPLIQSTAVWCIVAHCERMIAEQRGPHAPTTLRDLRKLLMMYDDFAMQFRPPQANAYDIDGGTAGLEEGMFNDEEVRFDRRHQIGVFIARMRLAHAIRIAEPQTENATLLFGYKDSAGGRVSDRKLLAWAKKHRVCHESLFGENKLLLHTCTLEELWRTLLMLLNAWPRLPYEPPLLRLFDELRCRIAFFMCYREPAVAVQEDSDSDSDSDEKDQRVLGLNLEMFGLANLAGMIVPKQRQQVTENRALIDNWKLGKRADNFAHVNMDFVDECERVLHAMQQSLRSHAGFRHTAEKTDYCGACGGDSRLFKAQGASNIVDLVTKADEEHLLTVISAAIEGASASMIDEQFKEELFEMYMQPGEMDQFKEFHAEETAKAQACIARCRVEDFKVLNKRYLDVTAKEAWTTGNLRNQIDEPAHHLLAALGLNFVLRQDVGSLKFEFYYVQLTHMDQFPYLDSDAGQSRQLMCHVYEQMTNTSTLRLRYKLMPEQGAQVDQVELNYEHPLILRTLCSHSVLYRGHTHACRSLEHAFLVWLAILCLDKHIGGVTHNYAPLQPFAARLLPRLAVQLNRSLKLTLERQKKWCGIEDPKEIRDQFAPWFATQFSENDD